MHPRVAVLVALVTVVVPLAAAQPPEARMLLGPGTTVEGDVAVEATAGVLDLRQATLEGAPFTLTWERAHLYVVERDWNHVRPPVGDETTLNVGTDNQTDRLGPGSLADLRCEGDCAVALLPAADGARISAQGPFQGSLDWIEEPRVWFSAFSNGPWKNAFYHEASRGTLPLASADAPDLRVMGDGTLGLFLKNVTGVLRGESGDRPIDTTAKSVAQHDLAGSRVERVSTRFAYLILEGARVELPEATPWSLYVESGTLDVDGALRAVGAEGELTLGGQRVVAHAEPIEVFGDIHVALREADEGSAGRWVTIQGDVTEILYLGERITAGPAPAAVAASLAVVAAALFGLYSRITRSGVLLQPTRERIHEAIVEEPGATASDLARRLGVGRVVVQYHLRRLEGHWLVRVREDGRARRYYPASLSTDDAGVSHDLALRTPARKAIHDALQQSPAPLSQAEIAERVGMSQRLVSYHLLRLLREGLARADGGRPLRYTAEVAARNALLKEAK